MTEERKQRDRAQRAEKLDPHQVTVKFPPAARDAMRDLAAATYFSEHVNEMHLSMQDIANGKAVSLQGAVVGVASIVKDACAHIHATGDERAKTALEDFTSALCEHDLIVQSPRVRTR